MVTFGPLPRSISPPLQTHKRVGRRYLCCIQSAKFLFLSFFCHHLLPARLPLQCESRVERGGTHLPAGVTRPSRNHTALLGVCFVSQQRAAARANGLCSVSFSHSDPLSSPFSLICASSTPSSHWAAACGLPQNTHPLQPLICAHPSY